MDPTSGSANSVRPWAWPSFIETGTELTIPCHAPLPGIDADVIEIAVIDVGSNSVRMEMSRFDPATRTFISIPRAPEWSKSCGMAEGLSESDLVLSREGVERTKATLARFRNILAARGVRGVIALGTAALRMVKDTPLGQTDIRSLENALGRKIFVLDGRQEAILTGLGILYGLFLVGHSRPGEGVCFGSGGASVEYLRLIERNGLIAIDYDNCGDFPIGALKLLGQTGGDHAAITDTVNFHLKNLSPLYSGHNSMMRVTGSNWREAVGTILRLYPELPHRDISDGSMVFQWNELARRLSDCRGRTAGDFAKVSDEKPEYRRLLPVSIATLHAIGGHVQPEDVTICPPACSIRNGAIVEAYGSRFDMQKLAA
ncbi:MAG TPA: hypothetical protein VMV79_00550 [Alphaproteobacteria bacterium]|nr:hypothetical protein [Alphaproteobacteria bacterium]